MSYMLTDIPMNLRQHNKNVLIIHSGYSTTQQNKCKKTPIQYYSCLCSRIATATRRRDDTIDIES